ncbi:MAG: glycosyltransferase family 4 protein [Tidjanibacter sp.]|nr:glycosyltransferase family 4 protein [Tidjanibacter sp.]
MNVLVVADGHYYITPDGTVYADSVYDYKFYARYLQVFDHVYAAIRAIEVKEAPIGKKLCSGEGVSFLLLPYYKGPIEYIKRYFSIRKVVKEYCEKYECAIFRIPAATSNIFCRCFAKTKKPFAVEVVVDPWENFGKRAGGNPIIRTIVRHNWTNIVKRMCAKADGASYVTTNYLQSKYPPRAKNDNAAFTESYSSVELPDNSFAASKVWDDRQKSFYISHVANYFSGYGKGHLTLMKALKILREKSFDVKIRFVGDGPKRQEFEEYAQLLGIADSVEFTGRLADGNEVRKVIANTDIFALPTFAEGLPRALLEAMSEGIPCLSSPTCGIPEVLSAEYLYDFDDYEGFAKGIEHFITNPPLMTKASSDNLAMAKRFSSSQLSNRRTKFYYNLRCKVGASTKLTTPH